MKYDAIVVAGGVGKRAGLGQNKVLYKMKNGTTVIEMSCRLFFEDDDCKKVILVINDEVDFSDNKLVVVEGGKERYDSVSNGLKEVSSEYVLIHDGARPFLDKEDLESVKKEVSIYDAAILAKKSTNTIKYSEDGFIEKTIDRNNIYEAETPQAFKTELIKDAYKDLTDNITDDAYLVEKKGHKVKLVESKHKNIKLTNKEDFENL